MQRRRRMGMRVGMVAVALLVAGGARAMDAPHVTGKSAIIVDARNGQVIWSLNPDDELPPASTTKVMTAILALESGQLRDYCEASEAACMVQPSKVNLRPGQRLMLEDLVYAILLNSANDAAITIAEHLAPSVPAFGQMMTARARELGATRTHFVNPHGLTEDGHYTTARDLTTIFRYALTVPKFREILGTKAVVVGVENSTRRIALHSHNRLLDSYRIPVIGKTGYTVAAKKCFVGAGSYNGREIVVAVMGSRDLWGDTRRLLEFGFDGQLPPLMTAHSHLKGSKRVAPGTSTAVRHEAMPSPPAHGARSRRYAVNVGTFDRRDRAERLQRALGRRGFDVAIDQVADGRGRHRRTRYRVEVGPYSNRGQAESAARTMAAQVDLPTRIVER